MGPSWLDVAPTAIADDEELMSWIDIARESAATSALRAVHERFGAAPVDLVLGHRVTAERAGSCPHALPPSAEESPHTARQLRAPLA